MRALFVTLPAYGHAAPLCAIAAELAARGHDVEWVAHGELRARLLPAGAPVWETGGPGAVHAHPRPDRPFAAVRSFFGEMLPSVTSAMLPAARRAVAAFAPDVVVLEGNCVAGAIAARQAGVPWVVVHVTPTLLLQPFRLLPGVEGWLADQVEQLQRAHGVEPLAWPLRSPFGTLIASSAAFLGPQADVRDGDTFVGVLSAHRTGPLSERWTGPRPRVLVTLGTLTSLAGQSFLARAVEALRGLGTVIVASPEPLDAPGAVVEPWVPVPALMPHLDLVVCHGGQGTVTEALADGVPLVMAPVQFDQPLVAARVEALGAGRTVSFGRADADAIGAAARQVLHDPAFATAARRVGETLRPGAAFAADRVLGAVR